MTKPLKELLAEAMGKAESRALHASREAARISALGYGEKRSEEWQSQAESWLEMYGLLSTAIEVEGKLL